MNRIIIRTNTADVESGQLRAYIVQKQEYVKKPSTCIRRALARRRKARKFGQIIRDIMKGAYAFTLLAAAMTAASLLQFSSLDNMTDIARLIFCAIWVAVPAAVLMINMARSEK